MKIAVFQFNSTVGAIEANADKLIDAIVQSIKNQADLFVCPELSLCGYPPEDLLFDLILIHAYKYKLSVFCNCKI